VNEEHVIVGKLVGVFGIRGGLKVRSFTRPAENILQYPTWYLASNGTWRQVSLGQILRRTNGLVVALEGVGDRTGAETLVGAQVAVLRSQLAPTNEDEFYWSELEGLVVYNQQQQKLGIVDHLIETGANDVLVVIGDRERLIPYIDAVIIQVDPEKGCILVDWDAAF
jgi:16S rRNA processing protein RimM